MVRKRRIPRTSKEALNSSVKECFFNVIAALVFVAVFPIAIDSFERDLPNGLKYRLWRITEYLYSWLFMPVFIMGVVIIDIIRKFGKGIRND